MSEKEVTVKTYNGEEFVLSDKIYQEYEVWRESILREFGKDLASKFPKLYGSITFNMQNGKFVNWNIKISGK